MFNHHFFSSDSGSLPYAGMGPVSAAAVHDAYSDTETDQPSERGWVLQLWIRRRRRQLQDRDQKPDR